MNMIKTSKKMMNVLQNLIYALLCIFLMGCIKVNPDPIKGADRLCGELQSYVESNKHKEVVEKLSDYWEAYQGEDRTLFFLALRGNLMGRDNIVNFIADADFHTYPIYETYMKNLQEVAFREAIQNPNANSPASKGILFGSLLANYAEDNSFDDAYNIIELSYNHLKNAPELEKIEFFTSFQQFMKTSGEPGIKAFNLLNSLHSPTYTSFQRLALESMIDYR